MSAPVVPSIAPTQWLRARDGFVLHQALYAVAKLGVADLIEDGLHHAAWLAAELKVNENALYRTLRLRASEAIFEEPAPRACSNGELCCFLCTGVPGSLRPLFIFWGSEYYYPCFGDILYSI